MRQVLCHRTGVSAMDTGSGQRFPDTLPTKNPECLDAVLPGQLLAFLAGPGLVADRHLVGPVAVAQQLSGDLGFHAEPGRGDVESPVESDRHQLEACLEIADVTVEKDVRG